MKRLVLLTVVAIMFALLVVAPASAQGPTPPPGLYVTDLRTTPDPPVRNTPLTFYATFNNTASGDQNLRWLVYIYKASNMSVSHGETSSILTTFAPGTSEKRALGYWMAGPGGPCENFVARVGWLDVNNQPVMFAKPDGKVFEKLFTVCGRDDLPKPAPTGAGGPPPGLFVTNLRIDPDPPIRGADLQFTASFLNTATGDQNLRWSVLLYRAANPANSFGETAAAMTTFPPGTREVRALGNWGIPLGGPCEYMFARVTWLNQDNVEVPFTAPDGKVFEKGFTVCAPQDLPPAPPPAPAPTAVPTPRPTPQPGLFVTDLRLQPFPVRGFDITFFPTFVNTSGNMMTFTWRVYIYKAADPSHSYADTTLLQTHFSTEPGEVQSLGTWSLSLGGPCDYFFARVGWQDAENKTQFFMKPDGTVFEKGFTMCPP